MKKQLLLLSLSLLLASCGGTSDASKPESQPAGDSAETSLSTPAGESSEAGSSEAAKTNAELASAIFAKMAQNGNCTFTIDRYSTTHYFGGDKGALTILDPSRLNESARLTGYGYAKHANYGIISYYYINDTAGVDATKTSIVSPNKNLSFEDFDNSVKELGLAGKEITFVESSRTHTLSTTDSDFIGSLLDMVGEEAETLDYYTNVKATFELNDAKDGFTNLSLILKGTSDSEGHPDATITGMSIEKIGTTKNTAVETYLASNITLTAPTTWDADSLELFEDLEVGTIPFPAQATVAASLPASFDEDVSGYRIFRDLGCGNITTQYSAALRAAGFAADPDNTASENGMVMTGFTKTVARSNPMKGSTELTLILLFQQTTGEMATFYPNGIFTVYAFVDAAPAEVTAAQLNTYLGTFKLRWNQTANAFPALDFGTNATKIEFLDQTEDAELYYNYLYGMYAPMYGYSDITITMDLSGVALVYYPTQAEAEAAKTALAATLEAAGYEEFNAEEYPGSFALTDPAKVSEWEYDVGLEVAMSDDATPVYQGYLTVTFEASEWIFTL